MFRRRRRRRIIRSVITIRKEILSALYLHIYVLLQQMIIHIVM